MKEEFPFNDRTNDNLGYFRTKAAENRAAAERQAREKAEEVARIQSEARKKAEEASRTDVLTGLGNLRALNDELDAALRRVNRPRLNRESDSSYVSCFFIDIDRFKEINDTYGHSVGDEALQDLARLLKGEADDRRGRAFRKGGDEFVLVQEGRGDVSDGSFHSLCSRVQDKINEALSAREIKLTISVGGAICREDDYLTSKELLDEADSKMYLTKAGKR